MKLAALQTLAAVALAAVPNPQPFLSPADVTKIVSFMTGDADKGQGMSYIGTNGQLKGKLLPLGFYVTPDYFGKYVCLNEAKHVGDPETCKVVDAPAPSGGILPQPGLKGGDLLQLERNLIKYGTNVYDAACYQIAMALQGSKDPTNFPKLQGYSENVDLHLNVSYNGNGDSLAPSNRAVTQADGTFSYNGVNISDPSQALPFRYITRSWKSLDPFVKTPYESYIDYSKVTDKATYPFGTVTWADFKPITGEIAWALFIGPMQSLYLREISGKQKKCVPFNSMAIQNAANAMVGIQAQQHALGGVFYVPSGSLGNSGSEATDSTIVSIENNASLLAGLQMFYDLLKTFDQPECSAGLTQAEKDKLAYTQFQLKTTLFGGENKVQGQGTQGMYAFMSRAFNKTTGLFNSQGNLINRDTADSNWIPNSDVQAADVVTWTIGAVGVDFVDKLSGKVGSAFDSWTKIKSTIGFYANGQLRGIGYSDRDGNGAKGKTDDGILSGEWSLGAINYVRVIQHQYQAKVDDPKSGLDQATKDKLIGYIAQALKDEQDMLAGMADLRTDKYGITEESKKNLGKQIPADYAKLVPVDSSKNLGFMYASKRYAIPFGWNSNPLPSTTSTAWALFVHHEFNPFVLGGGYVAKKK